MTTMIKCVPQLVFKETLSLDRLGYTNVVQFLSSMPEVCVLQRTSATGNWIVFAREEGRRPSLIWSFMFLTIMLCDVVLLQFYHRNC